MALSKIDAANFLTGTIPQGNVANASLGAVTALPAGVGGKVLQVVTATDNTPLSSSSTSYIDTGLSASITPSSSSNKVLVIVTTGVHGVDAATSQGMYLKLVRDSTDLIQQNSWGSHPTITYIYGQGHCFNYLDSPSSTSSTTYKLQYKSGDGTNHVLENGSTAVMTLLEVSA
jgi:hypothetical protein